MRLVTQTLVKLYTRVDKLSINWKDIWVFLEKEYYNIWLESVGMDSDVVYPNGISTLLIRLACSVDHRFEIKPKCETDKINC